jgi:hypothetical protein
MALLACCALALAGCPAPGSGDNNDNNGNDNTGGTTTTVDAPTFTVSAGTYSSDQSVSIQTTTSGATIYYTTNGTTPTTSSSLFSSGSPIAVNGPTTTMTIKAYAVKSGSTDSAVAAATYFVNTPYAWSNRSSLVNGGLTYFWGTVDSSADGNSLVIGQSDASSKIYTSPDQGASWSAVTVSTNNPGSFVALAAGGGYFVTTDQSNVFVSSDSGVNYTKFTSNPPGGTYRAVGSSSDGQYMIAPDDGGSLWVSSNHGSSWTNTSVTGDWRAVDVSSDGQYMAAVDGTLESLVGAGDGGNVWLSGDHGSSWTELTDTTGIGFVSVAVSDNGNRIVAGQNGSDYLWRSVDGGTNWFQDTGTTQQQYFAVDMSSDGSHIVIADYAGDIWTSANFGATWHDEGASSPGSAQWTAVTISSDGYKIAATADSPQMIWTAVKQP